MISRCASSPISRQVVTLLLLFWVTHGAAWSAPFDIQTEEIPIRHARVEQVLSLCKALYPQAGYMVRQKNLVVAGERQTLDAIKQFIATVDVVIQRVRLEFRLVALTDEGARQVAYTIGGRSGTHQVDRAHIPPPAFWRNAALVLDSTLWPVLSTSGGARDLQIRQLVASSGEQQGLLLGDSMPFACLDADSNQFQIRFVHVGVRLYVTPHAFSDGSIDVVVSHEVSILSGVLLDATTALSPAERTIVHLRSGSTAVLVMTLFEWENPAAIIRPFLAGLPVLGAAFRPRHPAVVVTVTPFLVP